MIFLSKQKCIGFQSICIITDLHNFEGDWTCQQSNKLLPRTFYLIKRHFAPKIRQMERVLLKAYNIQSAKATMEESSFVSAEYLPRSSQNLIKKRHSKINGASKSIKSLKNSKLQDQCMEWHVSKKSTTYYWSSSENKNYIRFLKKHSGLLQLSPIERKSKKVNLQMSKLVKTRTPTQCHTHHQKMMARYGSVESIIDHLQLNPDGLRRKTCQAIVKEEASQIILEQCVKEIIEMKSASEILAIQPMLYGESHSLELFDLLEEIYEPAYTTTTKDLMEWIDVEAFLL